jgi:hypothetical protein
MVLRAVNVRNKFLVHKVIPCIMHGAINAVEIQYQQIIKNIAYQLKTIS